jgi:hypothetical protein
LLLLSFFYNKKRRSVFPLTGLAAALFYFIMNAFIIFRQLKKEWIAPDLQKLMGRGDKHDTGYTFIYILFMAAIIDCTLLSSCKF